ncbi:hypothetical protein QP519_11615, partial [Weeksella virosa]|nr:hypothetical protein [Weeksella virosa]
ANVDILYDQARDRYDRSIKYLNQLAKGDISLDSLPQVKPPIDPNDPNDPNNNDTYPFTYGSREKFNYE